MIRILLAEDDRALNELIASCLIANGYAVTACPDGLAALEALATAEYALLISDIMMPRLDGFALAEAVRQAGYEFPILFLSARDDKPAKLLGYRLGIDDYIVKPFDLDLLPLKVAALLRRAGIAKNKIVTAGNLTMNAEERSAAVSGREISLTAREFDLLFKLLSYPKKTFTRSALMEEFWDFDSSATSRTVDVYMAKLREKTADCDGFVIQTVHGLGYKAVLT